jgi:hypothetical protein
VLREASIKSHASLFFNEVDASTVSVANSEVEGYEDLLWEDAKAHAARRASNCLDRARSKDSRNSSGDPGSPSTSAVFRSLAVERGGRAAACAAAAALLISERGGGLGSTMIMSHSVTTTPRTSEDKESSDILVHLQTEQFVREEIVPVQANEYAGEWLARISEGSASHQASDAATAAFTSGSMSSGGIPDPALSTRNTASGGGALSSLYHPPSSHKALHAASVCLDQEWDLSFCDASVEREYKKYMTSAFTWIDRAGGAALASSVVALTTAFDFRVIALFVAFLMPGVLSLTVPTWWNTARSTTLPIFRFFPTFILRSTEIFNGTAAQLSVDSSIIAIALGITAIVHPVPLRLHLPLQLLCMWTSVDAGWLEFAFSFVIPTGLIYWGEWWARARFLRSLRRHT